MRATLRLLIGRQTLAILLVVLACSLAVRLAPLSDYLNEGIVALMSPAVAGSGTSRTLVIQYEPGEPVTDEAVIELVQQLRSFGALVIAMTDLPENTSNSLLDELLSQGIVVGMPVVSITDLLPEQQAKMSVSDIPPSGLQNRHSTWELVEGRPLDTIAGALVRRVDPVLIGDTRDFFINFRAVGAIPTISMRQAVGGSLIPELVRGRAVIVGPATQGNDVMLDTVIGPVSPTGFHAYATDTLLRDLDIRRLDLLTELLMFVMAALTATAVLLVIRRFLWLGAGIASLLCVLAAYGAIRLGLALPTAELLLIVWVASLMILRTGRLEQGKALNTLIAEYRQQQQERLSNKGFLEQEDHWQQILNLVNQTLELNRVLFLERNQGVHQVREIVSYNCSFGDIEEERRDYDREPYRTAISTRAPMELSRPYLSPMEDDRQFLVALSFGGEVLGFWALSVSMTRSMDQRQFLDALGGFADQISELLHLRNAYQRERSLDGTGSSVGNLQATDLLRDLLASADRRLMVFESAFYSQSTAMIVYDLFGNVVQVNRAMTEVLGRIGFAVYTATALDFLVRMTQKDVPYCRSLLRYVILNKQRISVPLAPDSVTDLGREYLVSLGPINPRENELDARLIKVSGLMIEFQDISEVQRASQHKQDIIERLGYRLRGDAESMVLATSLLEEDDLDEDSRKEFMQLLADKVNSATTVLAEVLQHLEATSVSMIGEACPVDSTDVLRRTLAQLHDELTKKHLTFSLELPQVGALVMAESESLAQLFIAMLQLLIQDAADDSAITVTIVESGGEQVILMKNEGFGIPRQRFLHYLEDDQANSGPEFERLRSGKLRVESWGGAFSGDCAIGKGFEFSLLLRMVF